MPAHPARLALPGRFARHAAAALLWALCSAAAAQGPAAGATASAPAFGGTTLGGQAFELAAHRGRVVMLVLWRSDCRVCMDKLPELRANAQGWKAAPFDLVLVNLDRGPDDAATYDRLRRQLAPHETTVHSLWHGHARLPTEWARSPRLPRTLIVDRAGHIAGDHAGRVPAEVWNQVADLLP